jgi:hypothetical protein
MSTNFKTVIFYGLQAITTSPISRELLMLYVQHFRPKHLTEPDDHLFVSLANTPVRVGRYVTSFFKRILYLNLTTTTIRSIVATETSILSLSGDITPEQAKSSINMGGHSGVTCSKFYQKRDREIDVENSRAVHNKLIKSPQLPEKAHEMNGTESFSCREVSPESSVGISDTTYNVAMQASNIGISHPCYQFEGRRITWTKTEVHHVGTWCKSYQKEFPAALNVVAKCLDSILSDKKVREHFHPHHLMDSSRLRWGWKKFLEENDAEDMDSSSD